MLIAPKVSEEHKTIFFLFLVRVLKKSEFNHKISFHSSMSSKLNFLQIELNKKDIGKTKFKKEEEKSKLYW